MCANQSCAGLVSGQVDLLKLVLPTSANSQLSYEQYQQTPYYSPECDFLISDIPTEWPATVSTFRVRYFLFSLIVF